MRVEQSSCQFVELLVASKDEPEHFSYSGIAYLVVGALLATTGIVLQFIPEFYSASARMLVKNTGTHCFSDEFDRMLSQPMLDAVLLEIKRKYLHATNDIVERWFATASHRSRLEKVVQFRRIQSTSIVDVKVEIRSPDGVEAAELADIATEVYCHFHRIQHDEKRNSEARATEQKLSSVFAEIQNTRQKLKEAAGESRVVDDPQVIELTIKLASLQSHRDELRNQIDFQFAQWHHSTPPSEILEHATPSKEPSSPQRMHGIFILASGTIAVVLGLLLIIEARRSNISPT